MNNFDTQIEFLRLGGEYDAVFHAQPVHRVVVHHHRTKQTWSASRR